MVRRYSPLNLAPTSGKKALRGSFFDDRLFSCFQLSWWQTGLSQNCQLKRAIFCTIYWVFCQAHGVAFEGVPPNFLCPSKFLWPEQFCFKHIIKQKSFPQKKFLPPQTLKPGHWPAFCPKSLDRPWYKNSSNQICLHIFSILVDSL